MGQDIRAWPMLALLLAVVVVAIGCVLWFMREAMQNERMAVREKLAEAYRGQLDLALGKIIEQWMRGLARFDDAEPGPAVFARAVREGWADAAVFPGSDSRDRSAEANAELLALENAPQDRALAEKLRVRVSDYESNAMPSAQRRFLMRELLRLFPDMTFETLAAEDLAARFLEATPKPDVRLPVHATALPDVWQAASPAKRAIALLSTASLRAKLDAFVRDPAQPAGVRFGAVAPGEDITDSTLIATALGPQLPGWRLAISLDDRALFDTTADKKVAADLWIGSAVIAAMTVLAIFIARGFGRQVQLARLKNDLVATVSHELKTPLTAMRALVETLLDAEHFDEQTTREYLQLLAKENARLSRLIENFLTFSRLERNKFTFEFAKLRPETIVEGAVAAMSERIHAPACHFEMQTAPNLPGIVGDSDALVTALLNLLDNAWKYSGDEKRIVLRTSAHNGSVSFAVEDHGVGLSPRDKGRVFHRFYQADQQLSRSVGGCGLGLSIVSAIVEAHRGTVRVASELGRGSTFTIELPA